MKYHRRASDHVNHERWLVSYADFITLLFAFFVVMFASARIDQKKAARLAVAIESGFQQLAVMDTAARRSQTNSEEHTARVLEATLEDAAVNLPHSRSDSDGVQETSPKEEDFAAIRAELEKALAPEIKRREVALRMQPDGLVVSLREIGFFDSGSATIRPRSEDAFGRIAHVLQLYACPLRIEGHTDTVPIHTATFASNWELSTARATEVVKVLIEKYGFAPNRLSAAGYAEFRPVASNTEPQGRQLNRRVDVIILAATDPAPLIAARQASGGEGVARPQMR